MSHDRTTALRAFADRHTAAWCSRDASRVADCFSPNGTLTINRDACVGREAIATAAKGLMSAFPDLIVAMDDLLLEGERVVYKWTLTGTNTGPDGTGRRVRISGFEEWQFDADGLILDSRGHFDSADYQRQLEHGFAGRQ